MTTGAKTTLTMQWNGTLNTYTHLTADNLVRWYNLFKRMEKVLEKDPVRLENVNRVRLNLEYALLLKYNQVIKKYPGFERTPRQLADSVLARFKDGVKKFYNKGFEMRSRSALRSACFFFSRIRQKMETAMRARAIAAV